jgi:hypothetical protein
LGALLLFLFVFPFFKKEKGKNPFLVEPVPFPGQVQALSMQLFLHVLVFKG